MAAKLLIAEDDARSAELLRIYLEREGFHVRVARDGRDALDQFRRNHPDLVLLDLMLPKVDGLDVCRALRAESDVAIVMVTARVDEDDQLLGFDLGADDYITKPFSPRQVVARVRAVLRRTGRGPGPVQELRTGDLVVDLVRRRVLMGGDAVQLTPREFAVLEALAGEPGKAFSRLALCDRAFGYGYDGLERTVDTHVMNLRRKLVAGGLDDPIETVYGHGYRLREPEEMGPC